MLMNQSNGNNFLLELFKQISSAAYSVDELLMHSLMDF